LQGRALDRPGFAARSDLQAEPSLGGFSADDVGGNDEQQHRRTGSGIGTLPSSRAAGSDQIRPAATAITGAVRRLAVRTGRHGAGYFDTGIVNSAPLPIEPGQRCITAL
jgi:hypothetical protein